MIVFKFEEDKKRQMSEYLMEVSIWRHARIEQEEDPRFDQYGYEEVFVRKFIIRSLAKNIS